MVSEGAKSTAWPGVLWLGYRPDMPGIVIVGAGFGGIGMGIALKKAGYHDFVILDATGVNRTLWPGFTFECWARTRRARRADYAVTGA
jgi:hypothetical protein